MARGFLIRSTGQQGRCAFWLRCLIIALEYSKKSRALCVSSCSALAVLAEAAKAHSQATQAPRLSSGGLAGAACGIRAVLMQQKSALRMLQLGDDTGVWKPPGFCAKCGSVGRRPLSSVQSKARCCRTSSILTESPTEGGVTMLAGLAQRARRVHDKRAHRAPSGRQTAKHELATGCPY